MNQYNKTFEKKNVIIHASAKDVSYDEHWGPLSIKCTIKGAEHYKCGNRFYTVNEDAYLIFNNGQYYSSYIYSNTETESFTINFSNDFLESFGNDLDNCIDSSRFEFIEKLYKHDDEITPLLKRLYHLSAIQNPDIHLLTEIYYSLFDKSSLQQSKLKKEILKVKAVKYSTQVELYKRLNYAKDFIHSCYMNDISLEKLAAVACLNNAYFLREFKKYFGLSPHQYIMQQRLNAAKKLLETTTNSISEICFEVGYSDVASFIKLFKKHFSYTPVAYRLSKIKKSTFAY